jgi:glycosyltransferase involved in cell wall biosynthesis
MTLPISVVIPCYRQEHWLNRAVESAVKQSNDVTVFLDDPLAMVYPPGCTVYSGDNFRTGVCFARNTCIDAAINDLIFCLDADDRLYPNTLERMYAAWEPGTFVYGGYQEIDEDENPLETFTAPPPGMLKVKNITYSSFLFHKDDWLKSGGYDPDLEFADEDYGFTCALVHNGVKPVRLDGEPCYKRMIHENSRTSKARQFWPFAQAICKQKWPGAFLTSG